MKITGYILVGFAMLNLIVSFVAMASNETEIAAKKFGAVLTLGVLGAYLIHRAKQKEQEKKDEGNWQ